MLKIKYLFLTMTFFLFLLYSTAFANSTGNKVIDKNENQIAAENGWRVNANGNYRYLHKGKPITSRVKKIGKYYYGFDRDGWSYRNRTYTMMYHLYTYYFNEKGHATERRKYDYRTDTFRCEEFKNGRFHRKWCYDDLALSKKNPGSKNKNEWLLVKTNNPSFYTVLDLNNLCSRSLIYNLEGRKVSPSLISKNSVLRVYYDKYENKPEKQVPVCYSHIYKIELLLTPNVDLYTFRMP